MVSGPHQRFQLADRSYQSLVKRDINKLAESYGFSEAEVGRINIIVSELASNLIKYATGGGELLLKPLGDPIMGIEIICLDKGPGMHDPDRMQQDGVSTFGSPGEGLGAIKRLSHEFDLYSLPGIGTVVLSRFFKHELSETLIKPKPENPQVRVVLAPKYGEELCGDGYALRNRHGKVQLLALDGLGHGLGAHTATTEAQAVFGSAPDTGPAEFLRFLHAGIRRTRGAVGLMLHVEPREHQITYCGIGNIAGRIFANGTVKNLISYNGILGHNIPGSFHDQQYEWGPGRTLVLHSDGLKSRWDLLKLPELLTHDASTIAAVLYNTFSRGTDDTLVVVIKS